MNEFGIWLQRATRGLAKDSAMRVRSEIQQHYESAREAALDSGARFEEACGSAIAALADPKTAKQRIPPHIADRFRGETAA